LKKLSGILNARPKRVAKVNPIGLHGSPGKPRVTKSSPQESPCGPHRRQPKARREKFNIKKNAIKI
jgi:hypothetical protein